MWSFFLISNIAFFALTEYERYLAKRRLTTDFKNELNTKRIEEEKQRQFREQSEERQQSLRSWNATANSLSEKRV